MVIPAGLPRMPKAACVAPMAIGRCVRALVKAAPEHLLSRAKHPAAG
ncbi:MAG: hypothetical protein ABGY09_06395 [Euryarchaeota archaeon]